MDEKGDSVYTAHLKDRRFLWEKYGEITLFANFVRPDGTYEKGSVPGTLIHLEGDCSSVHCGDGRKQRIFSVSALCLKIRICRTNIDWHSENPVIAATNKHLEEEIERGNFREDLFYRLNVIPFYVPPLRDRREDIPLLADYFLKEYTSAYGRKPKELTPEAYRVLREYHWPGNVRELRNLMERIVIMNPQVRVDARHIPLGPTRRAVAERPINHFASLQEVRQAAEREYILKKLEETNGNVSRTAELVGLERSNLYRKMKALGIAPKE